MDNTYLDYYGQEGPYMDNYDRFDLNESEESNWCSICGNATDECGCNEYDDF